MKKLVLALTMTIFMLAFLESCTVSKTDLADTDAPPGISAGMTGQTTDASSPTSPQTTDLPAITDGTDQKLSLNEDMLAFYGMTFDELEARYGRCFASENIMGGPAYAFENAYGWCCFYGPVDSVETGWIHDTDGDKSFVMPQKDAKCYVLYQALAKNLFDRPFDTLKLSEIADIEGVGLVDPEEHDGSYGAYATCFSFDGFKYPQTKIVIYHNSEDTITPDSTFTVFLHSDYVKE